MPAGKGKFKVVVQQPSGGITFDLAVNIAPPAGNAACATAMSVSDGSHLTSQNTAFATDPDDDRNRMRSAP